LPGVSIVATFIVGASGVGATIGRIVATFIVGAGGVRAVRGSFICE